MNSTSPLRSLLTLLSLSLSLLFFSCDKKAAETQPPPQLADTSDNTAVEEPKKDVPKKVAVYDSGCYDTLEALGIKPAGVPKSLYMQTKNLDDVPKIGTVFEPDLEALSELQPDLIYVAALTAKKLDAVSEIAPAENLSLKGENLFLESQERLDKVAKTFQKEKEAEQVKASMNKLRDDTKELAKGIGSVMILMVTGPKIAIFTETSTLGWLARELDLKLIKGDKDENGRFGSPVSFEYIAKANPDWLIVIDRAKAIHSDDLPNAHSVLDNELVGKTTAWQKNQVLYIDPSNVYTIMGGPQAIQRTLTELNTAFKAFHEQNPTP